MGGAGRRLRVVLGDEEDEEVVAGTFCFIGGGGLWVLTSLVIPSRTVERGRPCNRLFLMSVTLIFISPNESPDEYLNGCSCC